MRFALDMCYRTRYALRGERDLYHIEPQSGILNLPQGKYIDFAQQKYRQKENAYGFLKSPNRFWYGIGCELASDECLFQNDRKSKTSYLKQSLQCPLRKGNARPCDLPGTSHNAITQGEGLLHPFPMV